MAQITRMMLTIPEDMSRQAEALKQDVFPEKSYAEMYRQLIELGLQNAQEQKGQKQ